MTGFAMATSRALMVAGVMLLWIAAVHPAWKVSGDGWASPREGCACREVSNTCTYDSGGFGHVRLIADDPYCDIYIASRWLSTIGIVCAGLAAVTALTWGIPTSTRHPHMATLILLGAAVATCGTATFLMIKLPNSTNGNGFTNLLYGYIVGVSGWAVATLVWMLFIASVMVKDVRMELSKPFATAMLHTGLLFAAVALGVGFTNLYWKNLLVRADRVTITNFEAMVDDMHHNLGLSVNDTNVIANNAATIIDPLPGRPFKANNQTTVGLWNFCLCKTIKARCEFAGTTLFTGFNCGVLEAVQVFIWLAPWMSALGLLWTVYAPADRIFTSGIFGLGQTFFGTAALIMYSALYDGKGMEGAGLIMFATGIALFFTGMFLRHMTDSVKIVR